MAGCAAHRRARRRPLGLSGNLGLIAVLGCALAPQPPRTSPRPAPPGRYWGALATSGVMTVGDLTAFLMYTGYVGVSIAGIARFQAEMMKGLGASTRLFGLLDRVPEPSGGRRIADADFKGRITLEDVRFAYPSRPEAEVLRGLSLEVPGGSTQALVGSSGCGKSTVMALLLRLYSADSGRVSIDGVDVRKLDPEWLRQQIGVVEQTPMLLNGTIAENIAFGLPQAAGAAGREQIRAAAAQANALTFIEAFPLGLDTEVGDRGVMLSGGQRQRIAIARAILKNPRILLMDEATSALDSESEEAVREALERAMVGRTTLQIAHRLSTISNSGGIAVLDHGAVAESGTYSELLRQGGLFTALHDRQQL